MASHFDLRFLGTARLSRDGKPLAGLQSRKALALLGYLALQGRPVPRDQLAALFWEDQPEERGRANLSWVLNRLATLLPGCLVADRYTIAFQRSPGYDLDIDRFEELLAQGEAQALASAAELYCGELLTGISLKECAEFEIWLETERERWRQRALQALERLIEHHSRRREDGLTLRFAQRLLTLAPWQESSHRQLMQALARMGRRQAALAQYESCRRSLAQELGVEPSAETTALYERLRAGAAAPLVSLPPQPTPFIGREEELARVAALLSDPDCRLLTILGPGGIGKTRLALQAAAGRAGAFLEGVAFVPLAAVSAGEYLVYGIAGALQLMLQERPSPVEQLLGYLRHQQRLLVLDGFEHLLNARELLVRILEAAPEVKLLVTSRERLSLRWEWCFELGGLDYPADETADAKGLADYSAARLFEHAARRTTPSFSLSGSAAPVARICRLVGGMPLALELAAAWLGAYSGDAIAAEIERSLGFLATPLQDVPERHRSMRAVFEQSWSLLSLQEQSIFAALSVFPGGFAAQAAAQVAGATPEALRALASKSLVRGLGEGRYDMHELLRQYAAEKLEAVPEEWGAAHFRHCLWMRDFLEEMERKASGPDAAAVVAPMQAELGNLRAVWRWAAMTLTGEVLERGLEGFARFARFVGPSVEAEALLGVAAEQIRPMLHGPDETAAAARLLLCKLLAERARYLNMLGMYEQAIAAAREAGELAGQEAERALVPLLTSLQQWGEALLGEARLEEARPLLERALALARQAQLGQVEVECLAGLAGLCGQQGEREASAAYGRQALELSREMGDGWVEAQTLTTLGTIAMRQGDLPQAQGYHEQALDIERRLGYRRGEGGTLVNLGLISFFQGDSGAARARYEEALQMCRQAGYRQGEADVLGLLGDVFLQQGDPTAARAYHERALPLYREIGDLQGESRTLGRLGAISAAEGDHVRATALLEQALHLCQEAGDRPGEAQMLEIIASLRAGQGAAPPPAAPRTSPDVCDRARS